MSTTDQTTPSRFVVGLDLGTTNSAMAYVDTAESPRKIRTFAVPQVVAPSQIEARDTLPSFHYQPADGEFSEGALTLPWSNPHASIVGQFARDHGTVVPGRMIASAKSWLCHPGVDRTADLLPWHGEGDVKKLSPVTVSSRYLEHFRCAWDQQFPGHPLAQQDFVLTIPASFDEIARELTIKAARLAGLERVVLIEEPQAAFYAWIDKHADRWETLVAPGQSILVCDVGGGTTDFTLIRVRKNDGSQTIQFHRIAVGDHLILGGDNLDLALAHSLESRIQSNGRLDPRRWNVLVRSCRAVKEILMGENPPGQWTMTLPGSGSKLIGGSVQVNVTRQDVQSLIIDGFFPDVPFDSKPQSSSSGFQEFGLPFAPDPAITKYLAQFLSSHLRHAVDDVGSAAAQRDQVPAPAAILFNGGVFASPILRNRLIDAMKKWFQPYDPDWSPIILDNERLDLAVARGAAYYGMVRRGEGVRIAAGLARTYYVGVETAQATDGAGTESADVSALCVLPAGIEPGQEVELSRHQFELRVGQPIEFPLFVSSIRLTDHSGDLVPVDPEQIRALPPIRTVLNAGKTKEAKSVKVVLNARLTEIGTVDLWCREVDSKRVWKLLFDVRSATQTDIHAHQAIAEQQGLFDESLRDSIRAVIAETFSGSAISSANSVSSNESSEFVAGVMKRLEAAVGLERSEWPTSLLRQLWEVLIDYESGRKISANHESRWLNLVGFSLRPGYGMAVDDWRCNETWKRLQGKLNFPATAGRAEWQILWRRVAGGITAGQQQSLAAPLVSQLKQAVRQSGTKSKANDFGGNPHESAELVRLLGSLELLTLATKQELGELLVELLNRPKFGHLRAAALWAISRIGARQTVYGPLNSVVSPNLAASWIASLIKTADDESLVGFAIMQLARRTGDRYRDVDEPTRQKVISYLEKKEVPSHYRTLVAEVARLESEEQALIFGELLPKGLRIS